MRFTKILDGSTGTQLQKRGYTGDVAAELWCLEHPEAVVDLQSRYIEAGSDVIYAPTFGANRAVLESHRVRGRVRELNMELVALSKRTADGRAFVAGDISPSGKYLYPVGELDFEELFDIYREQAEALEAAGVDLFVIETMVALSDARAALLAVKSVSDKPVFVTFSCDESGRTMMGTDVVAALVVMQSMGADAFGLNCSTGPEAMLKQLRRLSEYAEIPLIAKPNAGLPELIDGRTVYNCPPEEFTAYVNEMAELGVCIFGGCCGTGEEHIAALNEKLRTVTPKWPKSRHKDKLVCATGKNAAVLDPDAQPERVIPCDDELVDALEEAAEDECEFICLEIEDEDAIDCFKEAEYAVNMPLAFKCGDAELLEKALRAFQGRAVYEGDLDKDALSELEKKYGLIVR